MNPPQKTKPARVNKSRQSCETTGRSRASPPISLPITPARIRSLTASASRRVPAPRQLLLRDDLRDHEGEQDRDAETRDRERSEIDDRRMMNDRVRHAQQSHM